MSFLSSLGGFVAKLSSRTNNKPVMDKLETLRFTEEVSDTLTALRETLTQDAVSERLGLAIRQHGSGNQNQKFLATAYHAFLNAAAVSPRAAAAERSDPMMLFYNAVSVGIEDLELIRSNYSKIFDGTSSSGMTLDQMRMSNAIVLGYIESMFDMCRWGVYVLDLLFASESNNRVPPYRVTWAIDHGGDMGKVAAEIFNRSNHTTIMTLITDLRHDGNDVYIEQDGMTIDQYADDADYKPVHQAMASGFMRSTILMVGEALILRRKEKYEQLKDMREWLASRLSLIQLQMADVDPESPEYRRLEKISQSYMDMITKHDKKLAEYENA